MPRPVNFLEGWDIPKPDVTFQLPKEFPVPESGMVEYQYAIVPTGFTEDKWVQAVEVQPTERSVVHRIIAYVREPGSNYFKYQTPGVFFEAPPAETDENVDTSALPSDFLVGYDAYAYSRTQRVFVETSSVTARKRRFTSWG